MEIDCKYINIEVYKHSIIDGAIKIFTLFLFKLPFLLKNVIKFQIVFIMFITFFTREVV